MRLMASELRTSRSVIAEAIRRLAERGHLTITASGRERPLYSLTSPVFGQKQGKEDVIVSGPRCKRLVSVDARKTA